MENRSQARIGAPQTSRERLNSWACAFEQLLAGNGPFPRPLSPELAAREPPYMMRRKMRVTVTFYSYFKELTGCSSLCEELAEGSTLGDLMNQLQTKFPKLEPMQRSTLMAVGIEYQGSDYELKEGDQVSLFPPVQGG